MTAETVIEDIPSITRQTPYLCAFFDFGKARAPDLEYFNCGLVRRPDGLWLVTRRSKLEKTIHVGINDIMSFKLEGKSPQFGVKARIPTMYPTVEHVEDPRAVYHDGITWISACNFVMRGKTWTGAHQIICSLDNNWNHIKNYHPVYGHNGSELGKNTGNEKNWIWFFHNDLPHLVYLTKPHTVVRFDKKFEAQQTYETEWDARMWKFGEPRGGTPPVRIGNEYWSFFHSSTPWKTVRRQYHMGVYAFEAQYPFRITRISPSPILSGSIKDPWGPKKPLVVFPCGAVMENGKWLVTLGVNDIASAWIEIPHEDVENMTAPVKARSSSHSILEIFTGPRLQLPDVTLVCIDDRRPDLASIAINECQKHAKFGEVKLFTSHTGYKHAIPIKPIRSIDQYCRFIIKELHKHIDTSHCLVVQWDGYVVNPDHWKQEFLDYDYIGSTWKTDGEVGNGGFSLRSKKLLQSLSSDDFKCPYTPEDCYICRDHRPQLESFGIKFATPSIAASFGVEDGVHHGQFGFHSFLTKLPEAVRRPLIFHHSGDLGDIIYSMPSIKALGGGVLYISPSMHPKMPTRIIANDVAVENMRSFLEHQNYIWKCQFTGEYPESCDYDFNRFRDYYVNNSRETNESLFHMQARCCEVKCDETKPWLSVDYSVNIKDKPIVVARSQRYNNPLFPWQKLVSNHGRKMVFVGLRDEYLDFIQSYGYIDYYPTIDLLCLARVISGATVCIMNQSAPCAIALGLGMNTVQESWPQDCNCRLRRKNAIYCTDDKPMIPDSWL